MAAPREYLPLTDEEKATFKKILDAGGEVQKSMLGGNVRFQIIPPYRRVGSRFIRPSVTNVAERDTN